MLCDARPSPAGASLVTSGCAHAGYDFSGIASASIIVQGDGDPYKQGTVLLPCSGRIVVGAGATVVVRGVRISGAKDSAISIGAHSTVYAPGPCAKQEGGVLNQCLRADEGLLVGREMSL